MDSTDQITTIIPMRQIKQQVLGLELLRRLSDSGHRVFTTQHLNSLTKDVGLAPKDLPATLDQLELEGWIIPIRRGVFAIRCALPPGAAAHPFEIAMALASPAAISLWTALQHYELVTNSSSYIYVLTHTGSSFPRIRKKNDARGRIYPVGDLLYDFVQIKPERYYGIQILDLEGAKVAITDLERTLLDAVAMPQYCGGWANVQSAFSAAAQKINVAQLVDYAVKSDAASAKRIGWLLCQHHVRSDHIVRLEKVPIKGFRRLDPSSPVQGAYDRHWMLQINSL